MGESGGGELLVLQDFSWAVYTVSLVLMTMNAALSWNNKNRKTGFPD